MGAVTLRRVPDGETPFWGLTHEVRRQGETIGYVVKSSGGRYDAYRPQDGGLFAGAFDVVTEDRERRDQAVALLVDAVPPATERAG